MQPLFFHFTTLSFPIFKVKRILPPLFPQALKKKPQDFHCHQSVLQYILILGFWSGGVLFSSLGRKQVQRPSGRGIPWRPLSGGPDLLCPVEAGHAPAASQAAALPLTGLLCFRPRSCWLSPEPGAPLVLWPPASRLWAFVFSLHGAAH